MPAGPSSRSSCTSYGADGTESRIEARAVLDASGTWSQPSPAGADGLPALGEGAADAAITYRVPDLAADGRFAGKHVVMIGSGHSAMTAVNELVRLRRVRPRYADDLGAAPWERSATPSAAARPTSSRPEARSAPGRSSARGLRGRAIC